MSYEEKLIVLSYSNLQKYEHHVPQLTFVFSLIKVYCSGKMNEAEFHTLPRCISTKNLHLSSLINFLPLMRQILIIIISKCRLKKLYNISCLLFIGDVKSGTASLNRWLLPVIWLNLNLMRLLYLMLKSLLLLVLWLLDLMLNKLLLRLR